MELTGKTINFLGDSITYGYGLLCRDYRFSDILKKEYNLKAANNYGINGTRIARQIKPDPCASEDWQDFCFRAEKMEKSADVIIVFGGVNDYQHGDAPLGGFYDNKPDTFCGALQVLYSFLQAEYAGARTVIVTPLHIVGDTKKGGRYPERKEPLILKDYVEQIKKAAVDYRYPVLDLFSCAQLNPNCDQAKHNFMPDGIHPSANGHRVIADLLGEFLQNLV